MSVDMTMTAAERNSRRFSVQREHKRDRVLNGVLAVMVMNAALLASLIGCLVMGVC